MGQTEGVADLVLGHSEEIHPSPELSRVGSPVFILVKVNVATELSKLVRIVGVGEDKTRAVERVTRAGNGGLIMRMISAITNLSP